MDERLQVCAAFADSHPDAAARALLGLPLAEAAALLESLSAAAAGRLLARLGAPRAARLLGAMDAAAAAQRLGSLTVAQAAAVLRATEPGTRDAMLERQPELSRRQLVESLDYPPDTVGAIMTTAVIVLDTASSAGDALDAVREDGAAGLDCVFVTDGDRSVAGAVSLVTLLRSPARTRLATLVTSPPAILPSRMSIAAVAEHQAWETVSVMPVCNRDRQLIGALSHVALRRELATSRPAPGVRSGSLILSMSADLVDSVSGLWGLILDVPPPATRQRGNGS